MGCLGLCAMVTWQYLLKCFYLPFKNFAYFIPVVPGSRIDFKQAFYLEIPVNQEPIFFFFSLFQVLEYFHHGFFCYK